MNVQIEESWKQHLAPEFEKRLLYQTHRVCKKRIPDYHYLPTG